MSRRLKALVLFLTLGSIVLWGGAFAAVHFWFQAGEAEPADLLADPPDFQAVPAHAVERLKAEFSDFFQGLSAAIQAGDDDRVRLHFDRQRMGQEIARRLEGTRQEKADFLRDFGDAATRSFVAELQWVGGARHEIRTIKLAPGGDEAEVLVRHRLAQDGSARNRWWLRQGIAGWQIYDWESLDLALHMSTLVAAQLPPVRRGQMPPWGRELKTLASVREALAAGNVEQAKAHLARIVAVGFPDEKRTTHIVDRSARRHYPVGSYYSDPDLGPLLRSDAFKALRQKYPEPQVALPAGA